MKIHKRKAVAFILENAGAQGVPREFFESNRELYGTSFIRRLEELEETMLIDKEYRGAFIVRWIFRGYKDTRPVAAVKERLIPMGSVCGFEWWEVAA